MTLKLVIEITDRYEGGPIRTHDNTMRIITGIGSLSAWVETEQPELWGIASNGGVMTTPPNLTGIRVFPAATLDAAKRQVTDWAWLDLARLDS